MKSSPHTKQNDLPYLPPERIGDPSKETDLLVESKLLKKRMLLSLGILLTLFALLFSFLLSPLYVAFSSDVLYEATAIPEVLEFCISLVEILSIASFYGFFLFAVYRFTFSSALSFLWLYLALTAFQYLTNLVASYLFDGIPLGDEILLDLLSIGINLLVLFLQAFFMLLIVKAVMQNAAEVNRIRYDAALQLKKTDYTPYYCYFPLTKILSLENPIQKSALLSSLIPMLFHILSRVVYDIGYGAPRNALDLVWMILYYFADIVGYGIVIYFLMLLTNVQLDKKDREWKAELK